MPEIKFTTGVQSLGREDIGAPAREAAAKIGVKDALVGGVLQLERAVSAAQYTKQMSSAQNSINDLYDTVTSKEEFMSSEIPEYVTGFERYEEVPGPDGGMIIAEKRIPASEIREEWFRQGMLNITNAAIKGSTAPTARSRISTELRTTIGPAAYKQLLAYNQKAAKRERAVILDTSLDIAIINGDRLGGEAALARYYASGDITQAEYIAERLDFSQQLDIEAYSEAFITAGSIGALENIEDDVAQNMSLTMPGESDMTATQRNKLRTQGETTRRHMLEERDERYLANEREGWQRYTNNVLTESWVTQQVASDQMDRAAGKSLLALLESDRSGKIVNDETVASWKLEVQRRMMFPEFGIQTSDVAKDMLREIGAESTLNGAEAQQVIDYIDKVGKQIRATPEMKQALHSIRLHTGMPESDNLAVVNALIAAGQYGSVLKVTDEFYNALFQYVDEFGAEANPLDFVQKNKSKYNLEDAKKAKIDRFEEAYPQFAPTPPLRLQPDKILNDLYKEYNAGGGINGDLEAMIAEIYTFWYGTPLDTGKL